MKYPVKSSQDSGFTLIELLVSLITATIILILTTSLIVSVLKSNAKNSKREILQQAKNDLTVGFSNNVRWAEQIDIEDAGTSMEIDGVNYVFDSGKITKNGEDLASSYVNITSFLIEQYPTSLGIRVELASKQEPEIKDSLFLVLSPRGKEVIQ